jgi:hypothetical protein
MVHVPHALAVERLTPTSEHAWVEAPNALAVHTFRTAPALTALIIPLQSKETHNVLPQPAQVQIKLLKPMELALHVLVTLYPHQTREVVSLLLQRLLQHQTVVALVSSIQLTNVKLVVPVWFRILPTIEQRAKIHLHA